MAKYKLIACEVVQRELCAAITESPNVIDAEFLELGLHESPKKLRERLQARIDRCDAPEAGYEAVLLGYGLCGNAVSGLEARRVPIVLARAHDCCTLLLGSRREFLARFGESLSASWYSAGYIERGRAGLRGPDADRRGLNGPDASPEYQELVARYGEDNALYVWDTLHPPVEEREIRYIETPETESLGYAQKLSAKATAEGKAFLLLRGSSRLLRGLVDGSWNDDEYLVVPPGKRIEAIYDQARIVEAR